VNEDGNIGDACFLGGVLAIMNTRVPDIQVTKDKIRINELKTRSINVHHIPIAVTFFYIEGISDPIIDANAKEEKLSTAKVTMFVNIFKDLCGMTTFGCLEVESNEILECSEIAFEKAKEITELIRHRWANKNEYSLLDIGMQNNAHVLKGKAN
jgi:exosome complex component RRP45